MSTDRNHALDLLRVLCILYIVGYWHLIPYTDWLPGYANAITEAIKDIALGSFVYSSGMLLARRDLSLRPPALLDFYRRRVLRIYPLYLLALLVFLAQGLARPEVVVNAALLISMFAPPAPPTLWFITMIMVFYLLAPFLMVAARSPRRFLVVTLAVYAACLGYGFGLHALDSRLLLFFPAFALGIYVQRRESLPALLHARRHGLAALLLPAFVIGLPGAQGFDILTSVLRAPLAALGGVLCVVYAERLAGRARNRLVPALSYASFGVYLFHRPVFETAKGLYWPQDGRLQAAYLVAVALPASFALAYAIQRMYDAALARRTASR